MKVFFNHLYIIISQKILKIIYKFKISKKLYIYLDDNINKYVNNSLQTYFISAYNSFNYYDLTNVSNANDIIWVFWWQGIQYAPSIVKDCINSIKRNSNGHKVILLNKNNVKEYADIPNYIYKKVNDGKIKLAHFSDILRFNLLKNYGGLWIDATMYCSSNLSKKYFNNLYTSGGYSNTIPRFVKGRWTSFLIGGNKNNSLFIFMDNFFKLYWKDNNYIINYFMMDYALNYAYNNNIGYFKYYIDNCAMNNNPNLFKLVDYLNNPYDSSIYKLITEDTNLFKLTYKKKIYKQKNTFYWKLINK